MRSQLLVEEVKAAFCREASMTPKLSLRAGNDLDNCRTPSQFDPKVDAVSDEYLETYFWGVYFLDAESWRHYLPVLVEYTLRKIGEDSLVSEALLNSLRPPDRIPPRLESLSSSQQAIITRVLDMLAFSVESATKDLACQTLEEWWAPGALYRVGAK